jgi:hypothetical protein
LIKKIISGGQTGADRAALDFAILNNIACGGWCPKGRISETGKIPDKYPLIETGSSDYPSRTLKNIMEADATLIFILDNFIDSGTKLTIRLCNFLRKPYLVIDLKTAGESCDKVSEWIETKGIKTLNVAGNRESQSPGIYSHTLGFMLTCFKDDID